MQFHTMSGKRKTNNQIYSNQQPSAEQLKRFREVYEVLRVDNSVPLFIEDHLARFGNSFKELRIENPYAKDVINIIKHIAETNGLKNFNIKVSCLIRDDLAVQCYIYPIRVQYPDASLYQSGIKCSLLHSERQNPHIKLGQTQVRKTANSQIEKEHVFETLLINHDGAITEGSRSNVFFVKNNEITTAPDALVLEGIMRAKVIELIKNGGYRLNLRCIHHSELDQMDAAFITGTSPRILPIKQIAEFEFDVKNKNPG